MQQRIENIDGSVWWIYYEQDKSLRLVKMFQTAVTTLKMADRLRHLRTSTPNDNK